MITKIVKWFTAPAFSDALPTPAAARRAVAVAPANGTRTTWRLEDPLYSFASLDARGNKAAIQMTVGQSFRGTIVLGNTGSGKSSGTAAHLSRAMLRAGYGGLVLCAKIGEADAWRARAEAAGRTGDLVFVTDGGPSRLNFLDYELTEGSKDTEGVVGLLTAMTQVLEPDDGRQDVWERAGKELLRNALHLLQLAGEQMTATSILDACMDDNSVTAYIEQAKNIVLTEGEKIDLGAIEKYYKREIFKMSDKTRSSLSMSLSSTLGSFKRGTMRELFTTTTTVRPTDTRAGKIIVIDLPKEKYNELGVLAAAVWKCSFQRAMQREKTDDSTRPVFLFADECHFFTGAGDRNFQTTARSSKTATVYLTQNFPTLADKYGGDARGEAKAKGLLGNLVTKIWHANDCPATNTLAAETIAKTLQERESRNSSANFGGGQNGVSGGGGTTTNLVVDYQLQPVEFQNLAIGGEKNNNRVTAILFQGGQEFPNKKRYAHIIYEAIYD